MTTQLEAVTVTWRTVEMTDDDLMTMLTVHLTPRTVAVIVSAMKDENGDVPSWHVAVIKGGETIGNMLVNDSDLLRVLSETEEVRLVAEAGVR